MKSIRVDKSAYDILLKAKKAADALNIESPTFSDALRILAGYNYLGGVWEDNTVAGAKYNRAHKVIKVMKRGNRWD